MKCNKCGTEMPQGAKFCVKCGTKYDEPQVGHIHNCVNCGGLIEPGDIFCGYCGIKIGTVPAAGVAAPAGGVGYQSGGGMGFNPVGAVVGGLAGYAIGSALGGSSGVEAATTSAANDMIITMEETTMSATEFVDLGTVDGVSAIAAEDVTVNLTEVTVDPDGIGGMDPETVMVSADVTATEAVFLEEDISGMEEMAGGFEDFAVEDGGGLLESIFDLFG